MQNDNSSKHKVGSERQKECLTIAHKVFASIRNQFPHLQMNLNEHPEHVDLALAIPKQSGLSFAINLNLQNVDELHLNAGKYWVEWFPCDKQSVADEYQEIVCELLRGDSRIVEYYRGKTFGRAQLERRVDGTWKKDAGCVHAFPLLFSLWLPEHTKTLHNFPVK